jgi:hypothetical protein
MKNVMPLYIASEGTYAEFAAKTAPLLDALAASQKQCPSCEEWFPLGEFEHPFYCHQSEGMESETTEVCTECLREQNEADGDDPQY